MRASFNTDTFTADISQWMKARGFIASGRKIPFLEPQFEYFDRVSAHCPYLVECIDIEFENKGYQVSACLALASAYEQPAYFLRDAALKLGKKGAVLASSHDKPVFFYESESKKLTEQLEIQLLPTLALWSDLAQLRDYYLYIGQYSLPVENTKIFQRINISPLKRHLRFPNILMTLHGYLGDMKQALEFLELYGIFNEHQYSQQHIDETLSSAIQHHSTNPQVLLEKYSRHITHKHWTKNAQQDLQAGIFNRRTAAQLLENHQRDCYMSNYEEIISL